MSKYGLYDPEHMDDEGLVEKADKLIDEFIATLTIEDLNGIYNAVSDEAWALVERCVTFSVARGLDINTLGFSDTASRECFFDAAFARFTPTIDELLTPPTAAEIAETLVNGNITVAREALLTGRTASEAAVLVLDVVGETALRLSDHVGPDEVLAFAILRVRRCVNGE